MFSTLIDMIVTDAHVAWAHFHCATIDSKKRKCMESLAKQLLTNTLDELAAVGQCSSTNASLGND